MRDRFAICLSLLLVSTVASADKEKAKGHFRKGMAQYMLNHYEQAIPEFEAGFAEEPEAAFLYNLAQSHAKLGHTKEAIEFYRKYLELGAQPDDEAMVRKRIEELEAESARPAEKAPAPVAQASPNPAIDLTAAPPPRSKTVPIVIGVVAAVAVAVLVVALAVALGSPREPSLYWDAR